MKKSRFPSWLLPAGIVGFAGLLTAWSAISARADRGAMNMREFGRLPVSEGRIKPLDTVARNNLKIISGGRESFKDAEGNWHSAIEWLADVVSMRPAPNRNRQIQNERMEFGATQRHGGNDPDEKNEPIAFSYPIFRIDYHEVLGFLGLTPREGYRYSIVEILSKTPIQHISQKATLAEGKEAGQQTLFDAKIMELARRLQTFQALMEGDQRLACLPPLGGNKKGDWLALRDAFAQAAAPNQMHPGAKPLAAVLFAYRSGDAQGFNRAVAEYRQFIDTALDGQTGKPSFEEFFNTFSPFWLFMWFYALAFVLVCISFLGWTGITAMSWTDPLRRAAYWLCTYTFVLHTTALVIRCILQDRPPITNLYSTAIFIGWSAVGGCLIMEKIFPIGIATLVGSVGGFLTQLIAYFLAMDGDTMPVMQAVLDTNFWLWTHVTCMNLGYSVTFMAGFLSIVFVLMGVLTPLLDKTVSKMLGTMIYGIICFGLFFSFVGTVLGGLWADDSWGRFWGWDPKENGALLIVLSNALILHARWGGLIKDRGIAVLAIFGNIVTAWSWFGVNMLGIGLHAYGFMSAGKPWLILFYISQVLLMGVGLIPRHLWSSSRPPLGTPAPLLPGSSTAIHSGHAGS